MSVIKQPPKNTLANFDKIMEAEKAAFEKQLQSEKDPKRREQLIKEFKSKMEFKKIDLLNSEIGNIETTLEKLIP